MKISTKKQEKISEQILAFLYSQVPQPQFTSHIAKEIARDEEFIKRILTGLLTQKLVVEVKKNPKGKRYLKRSRWVLSEGAYQVYKQSQMKDIIK
jgi:hypothetical protein